MKIKIIRILLFSLVVFLQPFSVIGSATAKEALVLYDAPQGVAFQNFGKANAIMLVNLIGHFQGWNVSLKRIGDYQSGDIAAHDTTFYLGTYYENAIPPSFLADVAQTQNTVVWFKYNIWKLAWDPAYNFVAKSGFSFSGLRGLNATPTAADPNPGFFDTVISNGKTMKKYYAFDPSTGVVSADPDIGVTSLVDPAKAAVLENINNPQTAEVAPYVITGNNNKFWYIADIPFSYIGPKDRYLLFCDLLHDILNENHAESHQALVRLEDVSALNNPQHIRDLASYLNQEQVPFSITVIPFYRDPLGAYTGGVPEEIHLSELPELNAALNFALSQGGSIAMHGYTHQTDSLLNPSTAVSADDFEFWNIVDSTPVPAELASTPGDDSWVLEKLDAGLLELAQNGYTPFAWTTPHYQASPVSYKAFPKRFDTTYQRVVYYTSDQPNLNAGTNDPNRDFLVGQFFPYIIHNDYYGQRIIPENCGNIEYDISNIDPTSNFNYTWEDVLAGCDYSKAIIRDGVGSFFFHPYWLEPSLGVPGFQDFKNLINAMTNMGFVWTDPSTL